MHIIAPARSISMLNRVIKAGADMVYVGLKGYCRKEKEAVNFETLSTFCRVARDNNVRIIVAFNKLPQVGLTGQFIGGVEKSMSVGADGIILNDTGLINLIRKKYPDIYIMASIGMSPLNWREVRFIADSGASMVLLSEFLELDEIREIREKCDVGLELFATGLREFGYTGKCILSSYHRQVYRDDLIIGSAKRGGTCSNACREGFRLYGGRRTEVGGQITNYELRIMNYELRRSEDGGRRTEDGERTTEDRGRITEDGERTTEDGGRITEDRERTTEDGGRITEDRSRFPHPFSHFPCRRDVPIPINGERMSEVGGRRTDTDSRQTSNEIKLRFQPFSILERDLNLTGKTQFFHTNYKSRDLLPYIDIFKIWQGFLKDEELYGIIEAMREMRGER